MELNNIVDKYLKINRDFLYLSKSATFKKISEFLENDIKVICDITDRDGKIGIQIVGIESIYFILKDKNKVKLYDRFLYNIIYNNKRGEYSLQIQDEYYEKIEAKND